MHLNAPKRKNMSREIWTGLLLLSKKLPEFYSFCSSKEQRLTWEAVPLPIVGAPPERAGWNRRMRISLKVNISSLCSLDLLAFESRESSVYLAANAPVTNFGKTKGTMGGEVPVFCHFAASSQFWSSSHAPGMMHSGRSVFLLCLELEDILRWISFTAKDSGSKITLIRSTCPVSEAFGLLYQAWKAKVSAFKGTRSEVATVSVTVSVTVLWCEITVLSFPTSTTLVIAVIGVYSSSAASLTSLNAIRWPGSSVPSKPGTDPR